VVGIPVRSLRSSLICVCVCVRDGRSNAAGSFLLQVLATSHSVLSLPACNQLITVVRNCYYSMVLNLLCNSCNQCSNKKMPSSLLMIMVLSQIQEREVLK
jgi:hypothetical protein